MRYFYRVVFNASRSQIGELESMKMPLSEADKASTAREVLVAFDVAEDHPNWQLLCVRLQAWNVKPVFWRTEFTPHEIESARFLTLGAWNNGFPQPQDIGEYMRATYDLIHACPECAYGTVQNAPFRLKGEPKWNRRGIMTTFWTIDEFFVPPEIWETVFKPFGIECRPVANAKGKLLNTVAQLVVSEEVDVFTDGLRPLPCNVCHRVHYEWPVRGPFRPFVHEPVGAMAKSRQAFGTGHPFRAVFISQELARAFKAHNLRGATFVPVDHALPAVVA